MTKDLNGRRLGLRKRLGLELFSKLHQQAVAEHPLRTLFWECTLRCNLNCRHCGSDCRTEAAIPDMPLEDFLRVIDEQITPNVNPNKVMIVISGGEVLVRKDLEKAGLELYRRGYPWGIVTNGLALTRERFESLLRAGLHSISVSFDGFEEQHNYIRRNPHSYERALEALRMIAADGTLAYDAVTCVTGALVPQLDQMKELLIANGIKHWRIFTIFPVGRAADDPTLRLTDEQFREVMEFIRRTRREGRIDLTYACEGF